MAGDTEAGAASAYWGRDGLERAILEALAEAGVDVDHLTVQALAPAACHLDGLRGFA